VVEVVDNERLKDVGICLLAVDVKTLRFMELNASSVELVSWPICCVRRFGYALLQFTIETGRSVSGLHTGWAKITGDLLKLIHINYEIVIRMKQR